jgi:uncharacterized protein YbjT (DUF2867 family)
MMITIATIGRELVRQLSESATSTRSLLRDPARAEPLPYVVWVLVGLRDTKSLEPVLAGTTRLFLLTANQAGFTRCRRIVFGQRNASAWNTSAVGSLRPLRPVPL